MVPVAARNINGIDGGIGDQSIEPPPVRRAMLRSKDFRTISRSRGDPHCPRHAGYTDRFCHMSRHAAGADNAEARHRAQSMGAIGANALRIG